MQKILLASLVSAAFAMPAVAAEQADVVIIGSGGAGLSAAVTAHDLGKKVIVLEKMAMVGGNTNRAAGGLNAAETKPQAKLGSKIPSSLTSTTRSRAATISTTPTLTTNSLTTPSILSTSLTTSAAT